MAFKLPDPKPYPKHHILIKLAAMRYRLARLSMSDIPPEVALLVAEAKKDIDTAIRELEANQQASAPA